MTVYLIRHAESVSNAGERTASHGGAELSSEGRRQAEALTAESFNQLLARVDDMLTRLRALPGENKTVVFTHGNFMRAARLRLGGGPFSMTEFLRRPAAENTEIVDITSYL